MGIHGVFKEIGPGERIALSKLALQKYQETGRPFRLAIDISIWLFQVKSSKGGEQPALRTFYYRLLRLTTFAIQPIFVFDGPKKPKYKRNKHTGPNIATVPEFLAKQLLKEFGLPFHVAPGEAEAECALLQREGIVDAVLSEDVDTIMFGSGITLRNFSAEGKSKIPTHVNVYDAVKIKAGSSELDREGMILVAMMSGGDYNTEAIPGCGPKIAIEAAKAGFGHDLYKIRHNDLDAFSDWKSRLIHELHSNESGFFKRKHGALAIPDSFPDRQILRLYTQPAISSSEAVQELKSTIIWEKPMDLKALRLFTEEAFRWQYLIGAKKFIRTLAPALLVRELRSGSNSELVKKVHQARTHPTTDNTPELRISYLPIEVVNIDLSLEKEDPTTSGVMEDGDEEVEDAEAAPGERPYLFEPDELAKIWAFEHYTKLGAKKAYDEWTDQVKAKASKPAKKITKAKGKASAIPAQQGAIHRYTRVTKSTTTMSSGSNPKSLDFQQPFRDLDSSNIFPNTTTSTTMAKTTTSTHVISLLSSSPSNSPQKFSKTTDRSNFVSNTAQITRRTPLRRDKSQTDSTLEIFNGAMRRSNQSSFPSSSIQTMDLTSKRKVNSPVGTPKASKRTTKITDSPSGKGIITHYFSPPGPSRQLQSLDLTLSPFLSAARSGLFKPPSNISSTQSTDLTASSPPSSPTIRTSTLASSSTINTIPDITTTDLHSIPEVLSPSLPSRSKMLTSAVSDGRRMSPRSSVLKKSQQMQQALQPCPLKSISSNRQRIRVRESLHGAFAVEDEAAVTSAKANRTWILHDVQVMDLTG